MPKLTEPGVKYFLDQTLKKCNKKKRDYNNTVFNLSLFLVFFCFIGIFFFYKYKNRPTKKDLEEREHQKKYYILSKIKSLNQKAAKSRQELITGLPKFENDLEISHKKF
jgi:hypothetical protein